jgi:hypothetical protein
VRVNKQELQDGVKEAFADSTDAWDYYNSDEFMSSDREFMVENPLLRRRLQQAGGEGEQNATSRKSDPDEKSRPLENICRREVTWRLHVVYQANDGNRPHPTPAPYLPSSIRTLFENLHCFGKAVLQMPRSVSTNRTLKCMKLSILPAKACLLLVLLCFGEVYVWYVCECVKETSPTQNTPNHPLCCCCYIIMIELVSPFLLVCSGCGAGTLKCFEYRIRVCIARMIVQQH